MSVTQTSVSFRHVFGISSNVADNISFADDDTVVYVVGQFIVQYNKVEKRQRFTHAIEVTDVITAFASGCGKKLAAIAERGDKPQVHVYDLQQQRRKKSFSPVECTSKEIICMQFSDDEQLLLTLTSGPQQQLTCWNWYKTRAVATAIVSTSPVLCKCSFNPIDTSVACLIGKDIVKFYRIIDKDIRTLRESVIDNCNYVAHCWLRSPDDHVVAGTDAGLLSVFRSGEFLYHLPGSPGPDYPVYSIISINSGLIVGCKPGTFFFYAYTEATDNTLDAHQFSKLSMVSTDLAYGGVVSMALSPHDDVLCAVTSDSQLIQFPATQLTTLSSEHITPVLTSFHANKPVIGMDVCARKPLLVTCSKDNTVRLWNIKTHELELSKSFPEETYSVAMHPTGLQIAIGFIDKLRIYHVLVDELRLCLELSIKGCKECRFSKGGNALAIANGNAILVIDFYTGEKIADLRGHNSKVRSLFWMESGCHLLSCGQDGAVYLWDIRDSKRVGEFVQKGTMYTSVSCGGECVYVVGNDRSVRELGYPDLAPQKNLETQGVVLTQVSVSQSKGVLFAGSGEYGKPGHVKVYALPLSGDHENNPCMGGQVTRMRLTPDQNFLVIADDQGTVLLCELKERQERFNRTNNALPDLLQLEDWSDEVLVTRTELDDRANTILELCTKVEELQNAYEYQLKLKEMHYAEKIKEETDSNMQVLEQQKTKFELLKEETEDCKVEYCEKIRQMGEKHEHDIQEIETKYQAQIMALVDAYQQLSRERDAQIERLEDQRRQLVDAHERYVDELTREFEKKLDEDHSTKVQLDEEKLELNKELTEVQRQLEEDVDTEIDNMRRHFEEKLSQGREMTLKYKGENGIMKKKFNVKTGEIEMQKDQIRALLDREKDLHEQIKLLEREVSAHKKEIKTRDVSIGEKEKKIYELKKKNQELDKFKFVLDFKIRELKHQIEPRQLEIMRMRDQIKKMDQELETYHKSNSALDELIGVLRGRIDAQQNALKAKRMHAGKQEVAIERFRSDLQMTIAVILDPVPLKEAVIKMIEAHGSNSAMKPRIDPDVESEYNRHREFLRKSVKQLQHALEKGSEDHMNANSSIMTENLGLIEEINKQKEANKQLKQFVQAKVGYLRHVIQNSMHKTSSKLGGGKGSLLPTVGPPMSGTMPPSAGGDAASRGMSANNTTVDNTDPRALLDMRRQRILALKAAIAELESRHMGNKAFSKELLPPMEGVVSAQSTGRGNNDSPLIDIGNMDNTAQYTEVDNGGGLVEDIAMGSGRSESGRMSRSASGRDVMLPPLK